MCGAPRASDRGGRTFVAAACCALLAAALAASVATTQANAAEPPVTAAAITRDGQQAVVGSQRGLTLYRWPAMTELERWSSDLAQIHDLKFSPDGTRLLVAGGAPAEQGVVEVWQWPARQRLRKDAAHTDVVYRVAWSPTGAEWTAASGDGGCSVWTLERGEPVVKFAGHSRAVLAATYLDERRVLTGGVDQALRLWTTRDGRLERTLDQHLAAINQIAVAPTSAESPEPLVVTVSEDRTVRLWQPSRGRLVRFARLVSIPRTVVWQDQGRRLVVGCNDGRLRWLATDDLSVVAERDAGVGRIHELLDAPRSQRLFVGGALGAGAVGRDP